MNWKRGLIRLWLLFSIATIGPAVSDMWESCRYVRDAWDWPACFCGVPHVGHILNAALLWATVSLTPIIVGAAIVWVVRGFQRKEARA